MSITMTVLADPAMHLHLAGQGMHQLVSSAGDGGVLDLIDEKAAEAKKVAMSLGGVVAVAFVVWRAVKVQMALAGVAAAIAVAALFFWGVHHISDDTVQNRIKKEINQGAGTHQQVTDPLLATPALGPHPAPLAGAGELVGS